MSLAIQQRHRIPVSGEEDPRPLGPRAWMAWLACFLALAGLPLACPAVETRPAWTVGAPPMAIGTNYWYWSRPLTQFDISPTIIQTTKTSGMTLIRIGGARMDMYEPSDDELKQMVDNIRAMGAEPIIQIPRAGDFRAPTAHYNGTTPLPMTSTRTLPQALTIARRWVTLFNYTGSPRPVRYWNIGNEMKQDDPNSLLPGATDAGIAQRTQAYFLPIAQAMKEIDPNIQIFGPDESYFNDTEMSYLFYNKSRTPSLTNAYDISGKAPNKDYHYCDGLSFHMYVTDAPLDEAQVRQRIGAYGGNYSKAWIYLQGHPRDPNQQNSPDRLRWGLGEFNVAIGMGQDSVTKEWKQGDTADTFMAGQLFADSFARAAYYGATYATSWSLAEPTFGIFQDVASVPTAMPSYWHTKLMAEHFTGQIPSTESFAANGRSMALKADGTSNGDPDWRAHANVDFIAKKIAVVILNHSTNDIPNFTVFDTRTFTKVAGKACVGINFAELARLTNPSASVPSITADLGTIPARATVVAVFDGDTVTLHRYSYVAPATASTGLGLGTPISGVSNPWPKSTFPALTPEIRCDLEQVFIAKGGQGEVGITLSHPPTGNVTVTLSQAGQGQILIPEPSRLTFSATTWNIPQRVTLRANVYTPGNVRDASGALTQRVHAALDLQAPGHTSRSLPIRIHPLTTITTPTPSSPTIRDASSALPVLSGTAGPDTVVTIYGGETLMAAVTAARDGTWTWTATTPLPVGTHRYTVTTTSLDRNTSAPSPAAVVTVPPGGTTPPPAPLVTVVATAVSVTREYGSTNPVFNLTYQGFVGSDTEAVLDTRPTVTCLAGPTSPPGVYDLTVTGGSDGSYRIEPVHGKLTITKASQTLTFGALAAKTYGDNPFTLTATSSRGLAVAYASSNPAVATVSGNQATILAAGTTVITASQAGDANYAAASAMFQNVNVNKKSLRVTANDKARTLGAANPAFDASFTGLVGSDTATTIGLTVNFTCTATTGSPVGTYVITPSSTISPNNYTVTYLPGTLTVSTKTVPDITWATPSNLVYGTRLSGTQLNASTTVAGTLTYSPATGTLLGAGAGQTLSVTFTPTDGVTYAPATKTVNLTVTKKSVTAAADAKTRAYGATNPTFSITFNGFIGSDSVTVLDTPPTATCVADPTSVPGSYDITVSGGTDANYSIEPVTGMLTVTKATQSITFGVLGAKTARDGTFGLEATASSGLPVTYTSSDPTVATIADNQVTIIAPGTTTITARQDGDVRYAAAPPIAQALSVTADTEGGLSPAVDDSSSGGCGLGSGIGLLSVIGLLVGRTLGKRRLT